MACPLYGNTMVTSPAPEEAPLALLELTTRLRKSAEASIVHAFRASIEGRGDGPTDDELRVFARLVAYETKLGRRQALAKAPLPIPAAAESSGTAPAPISSTGAPASTQQAPKTRKSFQRLAVAVAVVAVACFTAIGTSWLQLPTSPPLPVVSTPATADAPMRIAASTVAAPSERRAAKRSERTARPAAASKLQGTSATSLPWAVARCSTLNFLSRAICMNNACAQPQLGRHSACADAVRQRRIDEARRNPLLLN